MLLPIPNAEARAAAASASAAPRSEAVVIITFSIKLLLSFWVMQDDCGPTHRGIMPHPLLDTWPTQPESRFVFCGFVLAIAGKLPQPSLIPLGGATEASQPPM